MGGAESAARPDSSASAARTGDQEDATSFAGSSESARAGRPEPAPAKTSVGPSAARSAEEEVCDALMCAVCFELLWKPVILECGHTFCFWCALQSMNQYDISRCPLCKSSYDSFPRVSRPLYLYIKRTYSKQLDERCKEMQALEASKVCSSPCEALIEDRQADVASDCIPEACRTIRSLLEKAAPDLLPVAENETSCPEDTVQAFEDVHEDDATSEGHAGDLDEGDITVGRVQPPRSRRGSIPQMNDGDEPVDCDAEGAQGSGRQDNGGGSGASRASQSATATSGDPNAEDEAEIEGLLGSYRLRVEEFVHYGIGCDGCGKAPIVGRRYKCADCVGCGYDLCGTCFDKGYNKPGRFNQSHLPSHKVKLVGLMESERWMQSLNRMRSLHPELSVYQILQWILLHYQESLSQDSATNVTGAVLSPTLAETSSSVGGERERDTTASGGLPPEVLVEHSSTEQESSQSQIEERPAARATQSHPISDSTGAMRG